MMKHMGVYETRSSPVYWPIGGCNKYHQRVLYKETLPTTLAQIGLSSTTCKYWISGNCRYGDQCQNLHSKEICVSTQKEDNSRPKRLIWWTPPIEGFVKINCDGAFSVHGNKAGAGGVMRNSEGKFVFGFSSGLKNSSVLMAELKAIKIGMKAGILKGYKNLIVESDSKFAIEIITTTLAEEKNYYDDTSENVFSSIIQMTKTANKIYWNHVFREVNSVADSLAKHALSLCPDDGVKLFEDPPYFIESHLSLDRTGQIHCR
ncbi:hypothetical protein V8G54_026123 [Vigna mungo]|uniref:Uncharacterized protein n=1 Tax=Vigna mungo TaxID=3915 RepID=A0AAQ3RLV3_VIGMU